MIRLIFNSKRWHCDLEWGRQIKDDPETEVMIEHDSDLMSQTHIAPEEIEVQDSAVPKAHKVIGFRPNREKGFQNGEL